MEIFNKKVTEELTQIENSLNYSIGLIKDFLSYQDLFTSRVNTCIEKIKETELQRQLQNISVDELNRNREGIRVSALKNAGYKTLNHLRMASYNQLLNIRGISDGSATLIIRNRDRIISNIRRNVVVRFDRSKKTRAHDELLSNLYFHFRLKEFDKQARSLKEEYYNSMIQPLQQFRGATTFVKWLFTSNDEKENIYKLIRYYKENYSSSYAVRAESINRSYQNILQSDDARTKCWDDFESRAAVYYSLLDINMPEEAQPEDKMVKPVLPPTGIGDRRNDPIFRSVYERKPDIYGGVAEDFVRRIYSIELCDDLMKSILRRYQSFGVKYILHQKRTLLGDEMGLGKTIQAIAALAHLKSSGFNRFLIICPLSVLINWEREIKIHSYMDSVVIYGKGRDNPFRYWVGNAGIALTTYETIDALPFYMVSSIDMIIVDEAHLVKNPAAKRTINVKNLLEISKYALYMSGTPLENRVDEMIFLLSSLNWGIRRKIPTDIKQDPYRFRQAITDVYLRRVREDVLKELPELIEIEDWMHMNDSELASYKSLLCQDRNFMAIRRVSWDVADAAKSNKCSKMIEICNEAWDDGRKVIVFSYFIDTLYRCANLLGNRCKGIIYGQVKSLDRQRMIDEFTAAEKGAVLVCQIESGGIGLNIQAASVIIICEPQFKPSTENQAISRAYRMGQTRGVTVHRLLMKDSVDERLRQLVLSKAKEFENYANDSVVGSTDLRLNENSWMQNFVEEERKRLGVTLEENSI